MKVNIFLNYIAFNLFLQRKIKDIAKTACNGIKGCRKSGSGLTGTICLSGGGRPTKG
jgi:hypothetical protein